MTTNEDLLAVLKQTEAKIAAPPPASPQLTTSNSAGSLATALAKEQELHARERILAAKQVELELKEKQLDQRNNHIVAKAKTAKVEDKKYNDTIRDDLKTTADAIAEEGKKFLGNSAITAANVASLVSHLMATAANYKLTGEDKKTIVLYVLRLLSSILTHDSVSDFIHSFVYESAEALVDTLFEANQGDIDYKPMATLAVQGAVELAQLSAKKGWCCFSG